ncbi:glycosyltransferase [Catenuloplanes atrovinosus]|uniref:Sterol 3beta-glucosyltransferase n=1 Tax=Catenuloplanes atrovinosus TaxID=137266 RepID=A0AAE4C9N5_9ACTN|nr:glycosyltransferase [Catenuloplanes atrovinosus]MDR7276012.1 sterol 3beta-glucosyltransferase [Catenuloplanes atrovinosus]
MKVLMLTLGTRGDVQPFIALAHHLRHRGHEALVAAPARFAALAAVHAVPFAVLDDGPLRVLDDGSGVEDVAKGGIRGKAALMRRMPAMFGRVLDDCWQVASAGEGAGADVVVHNGQVIAGQHVAEKLGVPAVLGLPLPMYVPTREFPWPGQDVSDRLPGWLNRATYVGMQAPALMFGRTVDRWRAGLGLPRRRGRHDPARRPDGGPAPVLHAVSPAVLPRPADWPATARVTGYWFTPPAATTVGGTVEPHVRALLDGRQAPVFVGFGSMAGPAPAAVTRTVLEALDLAGVPGIVAGGWGGLQRFVSDRHAFVAGDVPHEVVFPRCAVIVHHGGAGTTAAAARAGVPQVICPFVADQPFWGRRMHRLGVAPPPVPQTRLDAAALGAAIRQAARDAGMAEAARLLGERIRAENGAADAVDALERVVGVRR